LAVYHGHATYQRHAHDCYGKQSGAQQVVASGPGFMWTLLSRAKVGRIFLIVGYFTCLFLLRYGKAKSSTGRFRKPTPRADSAAEPAGTAQKKKSLTVSSEGF